MKKSLWRLKPRQLLLAAASWPQWHRIVCGLSGANILHSVQLASQWRLLSARPHSGCKGAPLALIHTIAFRKTRLGRSW